MSGCYDTVIDLFTEVKDFTTRLSVYTRQNISQELRELVTNILVSLIHICDLSAKLIKDGRIAKYFKNIVLGEDEKVRAELTKLQRFTESEERMVSALTLSVVNEIREQFSKLNSGIIGKRRHGPYLLLFRVL